MRSAFPRNCLGAATENTLWPSTITNSTSIVARSLLETCDQLVRHLPSGRAHLRDQIDRAASSIVGNIAEGAGEFSRKEMARFYRMARRSAIEIAAWLDILVLRREAPEPVVQQASRQLEEVVSMLVKLIHSCEG